MVGNIHTAHVMMSVTSNGLARVFLMETILSCYFADQNRYQSQEARGKMYGVEQQACQDCDLIIQYRATTANARRMVFGGSLTNRQLGVDRRQLAIDPVTRKILGLAQTTRRVVSALCNVA